LPDRRVSSALRYVILLAVIAGAAPLAADSQEEESPSLVAAFDREVAFESGGLTIPGTLSFPDHRSGDRLPAYVLVHGSGPNDRNAWSGFFPVFKEIASGLVKKGAVVLRYDKRAFLLGEKYKKAEDKAAVLEELKKVLPDHFIDDARAAFDYLAAQPEVDPEDITLIGHSQGGSFAFDIAAGKGFARLVLLAPGLLSMEEQTIHQLNYQIEYLGKLGMTDTVEKTRAVLKDYEALFAKIHDEAVPDETFLSGASKRFYLRWNELTANMDEKIVGTKTPTLIVQGDKDLLCPVELVREKEALYTINPRISIVYIKNMRHDLHDFVFGLFKPALVDAIWEHRAATPRAEKTE